MKLYHVTTNLLHDGFFTPSIPFVRFEDENATIERVSTSFSIEGAISGMPKGGLLLRDTLTETNGMLRICELDTAGAGLGVKDLVMPYALQKEGLVADALITEEVWVLKPFTAQRIVDVRVLDWEEMDEELVLTNQKEQLKQYLSVVRIEDVNLQIVKEMSINGVN